LAVETPAALVLRVVVMVRGRAVALVPAVALRVGAWLVAAYAQGLLLVAAALGLVVWGPVVWEIDAIYAHSGRSALFGLLVRVHDLRLKNVHHNLGMKSAWQYLSIKQKMTRDQRSAALIGNINTARLIAHESISRKSEFTFSIRICGTSRVKLLQFICILAAAPRGALAYSMPKWILYVAS
jgi:hypothetical protein